MRLIRARYVWMRMSADCLAFARSCAQCQASKIVRHVRSPLSQRPLPDDRFLSLHLDLVGPLPESEGKTYLLTIIDRYSRWLEAVPLSSTTAADCAQALLHHWVSRFGVPQDVTTDQGPQFTSVLWQELMSALGIKALRTTSYHPQCNGMVERIHRVLKERLMSRSARPSDWMSNLPLVLLGIRSATREDSAVSPAHLVLGTPLRLPGEFFSPGSHAPPRASEFVAQLQRSLRGFVPAQPEFHVGHRQDSVPASLSSCAAVFVRVDAVKRPLTRPYMGPYQVLERNAKTFVLSKSGKPWTVSIDRLKPCFLPISAPLSSASVSPPPAASPSQSSMAATQCAPPPAAPIPSTLPPAPAPLMTRAGRLVRPPDRYSA